MILPKRRTDGREFGPILIAIILILTVATGLLATNVFLFPKIAKGGEFLTIWNGVRAFLFEPASPYSTYVPDHVQQMVYERRAEPGENPFILDTPFSILLLFFPFSLFENASTALVIFQLLIEITLLWFTIACMKFVNWNPKLDLRVAYFLFMILNYFTIYSLFEGSLSILVVAGIVALLLSLRTGRDELAGALVALLSFKWQLTTPILIFVILRVVRFRMWRVVAGFGMLTFVLTIISYFLFPGWTIPYLRALVNDLRSDYGFSSFTSFVELFPVHGIQVAWFVTLILIFITIFEWVRAQDKNSLQLAWAASLTLAVTPLLGFRFEFQDLPVLLIPTTLILAVVGERWTQTGNWSVIGFMVTFLSLSWVASDDIFNILQTALDHQMFLFFPIMVIFGLYWVRWWALRPPRTWLDQITRTGV